MNYKVTAIVPSAGLGKRFGPDTNKPFQILDGKPLVVWSLETLESVDEIEEIIPILKEGDREKASEVIGKYKLSKVKKMAAGGKERQDSVYNGLKLVENGTGIILIHDGARPFIDKALIQDALRQMLDILKHGEDCDGVVLGVPVKDTIKEVKKGIVKKTLRRDSLWAIQTPQVFLYSSLAKAFEKAIREGFYSTDDAALVEKYGGKVRVIMGSYRNIKITTLEDLTVAEYFLRESDRKKISHHPSLPKRGIPPFGKGR
jgi:2-C-methyl-D-erythritol 4-phosphate cytidylyltransferase